MSILKRLFGGGEKPAAAPPAAAGPAPAAAADPRAAVQAARDAVRVIRRQRDPMDWAVAQQYLANALIQLAEVQTGGTAISTFEEAESVLYDATDAAGLDGDPGFRASMTNLWAYAAWRRAERLDGDAKGVTLADAANRFTEAQAMIAPETQRALWTDIGFYRGAVFHALGTLKGGADGVAWLDEAAAIFQDLATRATEDGRIHPFAIFNRYIVLDERARLMPESALPTLTEARRCLVQAMSDPASAPMRDQYQSRLATLDEAIAAARG